VTILPYLTDVLAVTPSCRRATIQRSLAAAPSTDATGEAGAA